jgi:hypothetical protein
VAYVNFPVLFHSFITALKLLNLLHSIFHTTPTNLNFKMASLHSTIVAQAGCRSQQNLHSQPHTVLPCLRTWRSCSSHSSPQRRCTVLPRARSIDDIEPVPAATLPSLNSMDEVEYEAMWIAGMIRCWLDDEWTPLDVHRDLGEATARVYMDIRQEGVENEVGDVVLGIGAGLLDFNFRECFVGPFDVANKVAELLMLKKSGCDVCCVSEADKEAIERWEAIVVAELENRT